MLMILARHAQSQGTTEMRLQGQRDYPLTDAGWRQAQALAERLGRYSVAAIYSSPIARAVQTAGVIGEKAGVTVAIESRVQEYDFGEALTGMLWREIREKHPEIVRAIRERTTDFPSYPGEEGRDAFRRRVCEAMWDIAERHQAEDTVVVVTHAASIIAFVMEVLGRAYRHPIPFALANASISSVEISDPMPGLPKAVLTGLNDTCHLTRNGRSSAGNGRGV